MSDVPHETTTVTAGTEGGLIRTCMKMALDGWVPFGRVVRYETPQGTRLSMCLRRPKERSSD